MHPIHIRLRSFATLVCIASCASASAQTGGTDDCANAQVISGPGLYPIDTTNATLGSVQPPCATIAKDVWFRWTPNAPGLARIETCYFGIGDTVIAVYAANGCPTQPAIACSDDYCPPRSHAFFPATAGTTYMIQVGAKGTTNVTGQMTVSLNTFAPNDECAFPTPISGTGSFPVSTAGATEGLPHPSCNPAPQDVWFSWTATATGIATMSSCGLTTSNTILAVYTSCSGPEVTCAENECGLQSSMIFPVSAGGTYLLQVGAHSSTAYNSTFDLSIAPVAANDSCATPLTVVGYGPHPLDTTFATTGIEGQGESACFGPGSPTLSKDLWYAWTASVTGPVRVTACTDSEFIFPKIVVYPGSGCPATGSAIACSGHTCTFCSESTFNALAGSTYTIQIGAPGNLPNGVLSGQFVIVESNGSVPNDDCSAPAPVVGPGPHAFDTTTATAACAGQVNSVCLFYPLNVFTHDVWFEWIAPASGTYEVSTCGQAGGAHTKIGVYSGSGCPTANNALACSPGSTCGNEARVCLLAQAGTAYTIQIGAQSGFPGAVGTFTIELQQALPGCRYDDGSSEHSLGLLFQNGSVLWLQRYGSPGEQSIVSSISTAFGSPSSGVPFSNGLPCTAVIWDDPDDDGNPANAVLLQTAPGTVANANTDIFTTIPLGQPQPVSGVYFVGVLIVGNFGNPPAPLDSTSCLPYSFDRAFLVEAQGATIDLAHLGQNNPPPQSQHEGVWLLRADCQSSSGTGVCAGDGTGTACPCNNASAAAGAGCKHSFSDALYSGSGARLGADGEPSLAHDQLRLTASALPTTSTGLVFQGTTANAAVFGDGLRCAGGIVRRLTVRSASGGTFSYGSGVAADPQIHIRGGVDLPGARVYQVWYRNTAAFCTPATFNLTNGVSVTWYP